MCPRLLIADAIMDPDDLSFLPLKVLRVGAGGKRTYGPEGRRRLIEWCRLNPKASMSRTALRAGVNTNQLRKWIADDDARQVAIAITRAEAPTPAFVPVTIDAPIRVPVPVASSSAPTRSESAPPSPQQARLSARLPNGVVIDLECAAQDTSLVKAMIVALGVN